MPFVRRGPRLRAARPGSRGCRRAAGGGGWPFGRAAVFRLPRRVVRRDRVARGGGAATHRSGSVRSGADVVGLLCTRAMCQTAGPGRALAFGPGPPRCERRRTSRESRYRLRRRFFRFAAGAGIRAGRLGRTGGAGRTVPRFPAGPAVDNKGMSQQGDSHRDQEDDWWRQLYDDAVVPSPTPDSVDAHFDSALDAVAPAPPTPAADTLRLRRPTAPAPPPSWPGRTRAAVPAQQQAPPEGAAPPVEAGSSAEGASGDSSGGGRPPAEEAPEDAAPETSAAPVPPVPPPPTAPPPRPETRPWDVWSSPPTFAEPPASEAGGGARDGSDSWWARPLATPGEEPEAPEGDTPGASWDAWSAAPTFAAGDPEPSPPPAEPDLWPTTAWQASAPRDQPEQPPPTPDTWPPRPTSASTAPRSGEPWPPAPRTAPPRRPSRRGRRGRLLVSLRLLRAWIRGLPGQSPPRPGRLTGPPSPMRRLRPSRADRRQPRRLPSRRPARGGRPNGCRTGRHPGPAGRGRTRRCSCGFAGVRYGVGSSEGR